MKYFHLLLFVSQDTSIAVVICVSVKKFCFRLVFRTRTRATVQSVCTSLMLINGSCYPIALASLGKFLVAGPQKYLLQWITMFISSYHASAPPAKA
jgi:hypothetical protein